MNNRISSCKICGKNLNKIDLPKTQSGYKGHVDENGKRWLASVCPECHPKVRKERYRPKKPLPSKIICEGCGKEYQPRLAKTKVCSPKCRLRVIRGSNRADREKQIPVKLELKR